METINAKIRKTFGKKVKNLRKKGFLPAVLYGPKLKNIPLEISLEEFEKIEKKARENPFLELKIEGKKKSYQVLIKEIQREPLTGKPIHVDFYSPPSKEKIETVVPLSFFGRAPAVEELGGTLVKNFSEVKIQSLAGNIPKEIKVDISKLENFESKILVEDLKLPKGVKILRNKKDIIAFVAPPEKVEEKSEKSSEKTS